MVTALIQYINYKLANTIFNKMCITDYHGEITGIGDTVRIRDHHIIIDNSYDVYIEKKEIGNTNDMNNITAPIVREIRDHVDEQLQIDMPGNTLFLLFASSIVMAGGCVNKDCHHLRFLFGYRNIIDSIQFT